MARLPAEWEPQSGVLLTWPHAGTDWAPCLDAVEALYQRLAALIAQQEPVLIVCHDAAHRRHVAARLDQAGVAATARHLALAPSNDTWARDHGPITVIGDDTGPTLLDFRFNGWGGKFTADLDDRISGRLHAAGWFGDAAFAASPLVLEGGAIDSDGRGTVLAVRRTLVDPARNPGWSEAQIEAELHARLGAERVLWLDHGQLSGDDTDGHVDTLVRFCDPGTLCFVQSPGAQDPDHAELTAMAQELAALRQPDGAPYRLVPLPKPGPLQDSDGEPLPGTYANFLIINGAVLVPVYDDPADDLALARLAPLFPGRRIIPLDCRTLIRQGGSLHCITMQLPAALPLVEPARTMPPAPGH
ncbi:agmatine deiminase family protein [Thiohalocapsa marina]|uniref:Agmatine deiminase family protein n=1 Tax=Thiohalocapsa marina TaxID=424902 RepID=A0A5M8FPN3_9GAMM|nr:agmatine deiminase family protein [Thiohalocapsa marina]KAA6185646.1 agmatine deiminase family protein [Thiohalocapsa marina]